MINRNLKDGSQAGWNAGGIGWNQTDECRHPNINLDTNKDTNKDSVFTLAWPTGTYIRDLLIRDPPQYFLGAVWDCVSSTSSTSNLQITFPWGETKTVKVVQEQTSTWYNPNNPNEWLSFWPAGCSTSGTYGIANYSIIDPCEGIVCDDFCEGTTKYYNGKCIDGECVYDTIENSEECGYVPPCIPNWQCEIPLNGFEKDGCGNRRYNENCEPYIDPCEDVVCNNICIGTSLYSQKCVNGKCIIDQLLEGNSLICGYIPPEEPPIDDEIEPPSDLTKLILPIGIGIGLLSLLKK